MLRLRYALLILLILPLLVGQASGQSMKGRIVTTGTAPAVTSCGSGTPAVAGNDNQGILTVGSGGTLTGCVLTFAVAFANVPTCYFNNQLRVGITNAGGTYKVVETTTNVTVTWTAAITASDTVSFFCIGR